jgi:hypothetical protein
MQKVIRIGEGASECAKFQGAGCVTVKPGLMVS